MKQTTAPSFISPTNKRLLYVAIYIPHHINIRSQYKTGSQSKVTRVAIKWTLERIDHCNLLTGG